VKRPARKYIALSGAILLFWGLSIPLALGENITAAEPPITATVTSAGAPDSPSSTGTAAIKIEVLSGVVGLETGGATPSALPANTVSTINPTVGKESPVVNTSMLDESSLNKLKVSMGSNLTEIASQQAADLQNKQQGLMQVAQYVDKTEMGTTADYQAKIKLAQERFSGLSFDIRQKMGNLDIQLQETVNTALVDAQNNMNTFLNSNAATSLFSTTTIDQVKQESMKFLDQMQDNMRLSTNYNNTMLADNSVFKQIEAMQANLIKGGTQYTDSSMMTLQIPAGFTPPEIDISNGIPNVTGLVLPPGIIGIGTQSADFFKNLPAGVVLPSDLTNMPSGLTELPANSTILPCQVFGEGVLKEIIESGGTRLPANFQEKLQELADAGTPLQLPPGIVLPPGLEIPTGSVISFPTGIMLPPGMDLGNTRVGIAGQTPTTGGGQITLPTGIDLPPGINLPTGATLPDGVTLPEGIVIPTGTQLPNNIVIPTGATLPDNIVIPTGATLPDNIVIPTGAQLPSNIVLPTGTQLPTGFTLPEGVTMPPGGGMPPAGGGTLPPGGGMPPAGGGTLPPGGGMPPAGGGMPPTGGGPGGPMP